MKKFFCVILVTVMTFTLLCVPLSAFDNSNSKNVTLVLNPLQLTIIKFQSKSKPDTETAKESYATNSAPIVVITPVTDSKGMYAPEFTIYPKSDTLPKPKTPEETQAKMFQTGHEDQSFFAKVVNWLKDVFK